MPWICVAIAESTGLRVGRDGQIMAAQRIGGLANGVQKFFMLLRKFVIGSAARRAPASQGNGSARSANSACWCR
jgi:hypothetical protein